MRTPFKFAAAVVIAAALAAPALAASFRLGGLEVTAASSRPAGKGQTGVGYFTLANNGKTAVTLSGAESSLAAKAELHETMIAGTVASMKALPEGVVIPAGGTVSFSPAGKHIMLIGLKQALTAGQKVPLTLKFKDGRSLQIELTVEGAASAGGSMAGMAGM